jgi:hypothetical protein
MSRLPAVLVAKGALNIAAGYRTHRQPIFQIFRPLWPNGSCRRELLPLPNHREDLTMQKLIAIAALAAGALAAAAFATGANADTAHRHHRSGSAIVRQTAAPMPAPTSFQSLYQGGAVSNDCEQRVFGFCSVR